LQRAPNGGEAEENRKVNGRREYDILKAIKKLAEKEVETGLEQLDHPG
jgi:uncharacterized protein YacL